MKAGGTKAQRQQPPTAAKCSPAPQQPSVVELFQQLSVRDEEALLFIQLPDSMPGQPAASAEKPAKESKAEDLKRAAQAKARVSFCVIPAH